RRSEPWPASLPQSQTLGLLLRRSLPTAQIDANPGNSHPFGALAACAFLDFSRETPTLLDAHVRVEARSLAVLSEATPSGSVV
ncbi:MAG: hypothetical protein ACI9MR_001307, partial [Myxococcota bacterium]